MSDVTDATTAARAPTPDDAMRVADSDTGGPVLAADGTPLKRSLNLTLVVLYGLGTTIGAGIYALTGEVAGAAGMGAPWAFLAAALLFLVRTPSINGETIHVDGGRHQV